MRLVLMGVLVAALLVIGVLSSLGTARRAEGNYPFEMHWGFVEAIDAESGDRNLFLAMDGRITIDDGDPTTTEHIHLISALLFEAGGDYHQGRGDTVYWSGGGSKAVSWRSSTTNDWDGVAVRFIWEVGSNPSVTIETLQWSWKGTVRDLVNLGYMTYRIGNQGQKLEVGRFFTLKYRVHDLLLVWGYRKALDKYRGHSPMLMRWDGYVTISQGAIRLLRTGFESGGGYDKGTDDLVYTRGDLSPTIAWRSSTLDLKSRPVEIDGLALNFIVPRGVTPMVTVKVGSFERTFTLPLRPFDLHYEKALDDYGHFIHGHVHWCWFKRP